MTTTHKSESKSKGATRRAEIVREYGPFPGMDQIGGVTFDGTPIWFARGESIVALDPKSGKLVRELPVPAEAGTGFDGSFVGSSPTTGFRRLIQARARLWPLFRHRPTGAIQA